MFAQFNPLTPQHIFMIVFAGVVLVTYVVNRMHCYDLKRNKNLAH